MAPRALSGMEMALKINLSKQFNMKAEVMFAAKDASGSTKLASTI